MPDLPPSSPRGKAKILFAVKALDNITGGAERVLCDIASALSVRGYDVVVVNFDKPTGRTFYPLHPSVRLIQLGIGDTFSTASLRETIGRMAALRQIVKVEAPDVAVAFMHSMFIPAAFALIGTGVRLYGSEHIVPEHYKSRRVEYALFVAASFFLSKITVLSSAIRGNYHALIRRKMVAIANPVYVPAEMTDAPRQKIILNVGRLEPQKDQKVLIEAFALLSPHYPDWSVRIMGKGPLRDDLQTQIDILGLQGKIVLGGVTQDIHSEYKTASVFAIPSAYESFGLAMVEAMAFGMPAVGFKDCPGVNEIVIDGQNGYLVEGLDRARAYAESLRKLMDDANLRSDMGRAARKTADKYSIDMIAAQWEQFLGVA